MVMREGSRVQVVDGISKSGRAEGVHQIPSLVDELVKTTLYLQINSHPTGGGSAKHALQVT